MRGDRLEIRIAGSGGQGVVTAGTLLAEAAAAAGLEVTQFQAYGPASRGGASWTDVIVAREPIRYPIAQALDVLVTLSREACLDSLPELRAGGLLVIDRDAEGERPGGEFDVRALPIAEAAAAAASGQAVNLVALAVLAELTGVVSDEGLEAVVAARFEGSAAAAGARALAAGRRLAEAGGD